MAGAGCGGGLVDFQGAVVVERPESREQVRDNTCRWVSEHSIKLV